jgi:hypothetical protein
MCKFDTMTKKISMRCLPFQLVAVLAGWTLVHFLGASSTSSASFQSGLHCWLMHNQFLRLDVDITYKLTKREEKRKLVYIIFYKKMQLHTLHKIFLDSSDRTGHARVWISPVFLSSYCPASFSSLTTQMKKSYQTTRQIILRLHRSTN